MKQKFILHTSLIKTALFHLHSGNVWNDISKVNLHLMCLPLSIVFKKAQFTTNLKKLNMCSYGNRLENVLLCQLKNTCSNRPRQEIFISWNRNYRKPANIFYLKFRNQYFKKGRGKKPEKQYDHLHFLNPHWDCQA